MPKITVMCATRLPEMLVKRIDAKAKSLGRSRAHITELALREYLDGGSASAVNRDSLEVAPQEPPPILSVKAALLATIPGLKTCATIDKPLTMAVVESHNPSPEIPMCLKTWWEDGCRYECLMDKDHREIKHGQRGLLRRLDD
jgi:hypothetical protein